jgi:HK97 family phage prohead protease/HK97 family phage major capsid protein
MNEQHATPSDLDRHDDDRRSGRPLPDHEVRTIESAIEIRSEASDDSPGTLTGYALLWDTPTVLRDFNEVVTRDALDGVLETSDVRALFNHDPNVVLGRSPNTLRLTTDDRGLRYEIDLPNTTAARDLAVLARRGDVSQSSYAFRVTEDGMTWDPSTRTRTIRRFSEILDVSPVVYPAQPLTEAGMRSSWTPPADDRPLQEEIRQEEAQEAVTAPETTEEAIEAPTTETSQRHQETTTVSAPSQPTPKTRPMNSNEMKALRSAHLAELKAVTDGLTTEARTATEAEDLRLDDLNAKISDLDAKIARAEATEENLRRAAANAYGAAPSTSQVKEEINLARRYSLSKAIHQATRGGLDGIEAEMSQEGAEALRAAGKPAEGRLQIPGFIHARATSTTGGTNLPGAGSSGLLEGLIPNPVIERMGAQRLTGVTGDIILPTLASDLTNTATETGAVTSGGAIAARKLVANRIASRVDISSALIAQMNESVDRVVASQFQKATAAKIDKLFLQDIIANVTFQKRRDTAAATVPGLSPEDAANLHGVVGDNGASMTAPGYISSHGVLAYAKHTPTVSGGGIATMINDRVLGHLAMGTGEAAPALITDASYDTAAEVYAVAGAVTNLNNEAALVPIVFADFADVYVAYWGGGALDLIVDPYTNGADGITRMIVNAYADAKVAHLGAASWTVGA